MVQIPNIVLPVVLGISLCSVSAFLLYILLKKDDDELENKSDQTESSKFCTKDIPIPKGLVAAIIGRGGSTIKDLEAKTGARINMSDSSKNNEERICIVRGSQIAVTMAENLLDEIIQQQKNLQTVTLSVPHWATGRIIGRGGENINNICRSSGAKITITTLNNDTDTVNQKKVVIIGNPLQIKIASDLIEKCVVEDKLKRETEGKNREPRGKHAASNTGKAVVGTDPGSSGALLEVFVSAVSSPSRFWLQIVGPQVEELDKLVDLMTEFYSNADNRDLHSLSDILVGQMVAAVFRHDGKWYRAKVVEIKPNEFDSSLQVCDVHFVDYGDNEYVATNELLSLRTDMLTLRYQAVECFLAGVAPAPLEEGTETEKNRWDNQAIERFEELTQVARWKRLWSRTCIFKERPKTEGISNLSRNSREGSPIPGVKLYDTKEGKDVNIGQVLVDEGWAVEVENEQPPKTLMTPLPTPIANIPPPSFGDLECSRVLGMVTGNREERASSLPHGGSSPSSSPRSDRTQLDDSFQGMSDSGKPKSMSLAAGIDTNADSQPLVSPVPNPIAELSYPKPETNGTHHMNGSSTSNQGKKVQNGDFLNAERGTSNSTISNSPKKDETHKNLELNTKVHPIHIPDPKDELKAKMNRVDSHHGSLETMGKQTPPLSIISPEKIQPTSDSH
ncbi:tudor and KH domain-containing protein homolog isoform X2 [Arctopsyche grandis]|uniref:tudor and KH domain-containing protein homolog isoform X2 n=1 Tax=Arctopsyche grandis TaxID=121162 RepID=UPI00406DA0E2